MGSPIQVPARGTAPAQGKEYDALVSRLHEEYMQGVEQLYNEYKDVYTDETGDQVPPLNLF